MSAAAVCVRLRHAIDLRDGTVGYLAGRGRTVDVREGRCTLWCATATCQSYARGETHAEALTRALATGWRHDLRARLLCPRCSR